MQTFLYQLIIMPLELMIEVIRTVIRRMAGNATLAVIGGGIMVSFFALLFLIRWYFLREGKQAEGRPEAASRAKSRPEAISPASSKISRVGILSSAAGRTGIFSSGF